jgi:hypothetical protein
VEPIVSGTVARGTDLSVFEYRLLIQALSRLASGDFSFYSGSVIWRSVFNKRAQALAWLAQSMRHSVVPSTLE